MRDSFIFYRSFYEAVKELPRDIQGEIYTAIMEYSLNGNETENLKPTAKAVFILVKPILDSGIKNYENGKKGGRPPKNMTSNKESNNPKETQSKPKNNPTETDTKPYKDKDKDLDKDYINPPNPPKGRSVFKKPTIEEIKNEINRLGYGLDAEEFYHFYESKNWFVGKNKMKNWKSALVTWQKNKQKYQSTQKSRSSPSKAGTDEMTKYLLNKTKQTQDYIEGEIT